MVGSSVCACMHVYFGVWQGLKRGQRMHTACVSTYRPEKACVQHASAELERHMHMLVYK